MVKLCFISTVKNLDLSLQGDMLYYLSHINNLEYLKFFRRKKRYKISDNSVHEEKQLDMQTFVLRTKSIDADEIIIPDKMKETEETIARYSEFMKNYYKEIKDITIQAVVQGKYLGTILDCYKFYVKDKRVNVIGIPFDLTPMQLSNEKYENQMLNRLIIINRISQLRKKKPVHLLGLNHFMELAILKKYDFVRSNDSKLVVRCARNNIKFDNYITKPENKLNFNDKLTPNQTQIALYNIKFLKSLVK